MKPPGAVGEAWSVPGCTVLGITRGVAGRPDLSCVGYQVPLLPAP